MSQVYTRELGASMLVLLFVGLFIYFGLHEGWTQAALGFVVAFGIIAWASSARPCDGLR